MNLYTFRNRKIRMFMSGDYEFLCSIYGITGANGKSCQFLYLAFLKEKERKNRKKL